MLWRWQGALHWASVAAALLAVLGFMRSLRYYDMREFLGLRTHGPATLRISPLHRHVRHPWYALALLLIWTRDMDAAWLVSCVCMTLYLVAARGSKKTNSSPYGASFIVITAARCPA